MFIWIAILVAIVLGVLLGLVSLAYDENPLVTFFVVFVALMAIYIVFAATNPVRNVDHIEHTSVDNISKVTYLVTSNEYLVDVKVGEGITETKRFDAGDGFKVIFSSKNQLVERVMVFDDKKFVPFTTQRDEPTVLLVEEGSIEIKGGK